VGGNWQIFKEMIVASGAKLYLNTTVLSIDHVHIYGRDRIIWEVAYSNEHKPTSTDARHFDAVVIAAPYVCYLPILTVYPIASNQHID